MQTYEVEYSVTEYITDNIGADSDEQAEAIVLESAKELNPACDIRIEAVRELVV